MWPLTLLACTTPEPSEPSEPEPTTLPSVSTGLSYTPDWDGVVALVEAECVVCHAAGGTAENVPLPLALQEDLTRRTGIWVVPFDPDASLLWGLLNGTPEPMPPQGLPTEEIDPVRLWILDGAIAPLVPLDDDLDGYTGVDGDCDDTDPSRHPGADERCDGVDNDCDGDTDGPDSLDATPWYADADADGFGDEASATVACEAPPGHVADPGDCDDGDEAFHPLAVEDCTETRDLNCDGSTGAVDNDGDGFVACLECNDADDTAFPGAVEVCDGADNDCDGGVDVDAADAVEWWPDADGDGYGDDSTPPLLDCGPVSGSVDVAGDCDDANGAVHPGVLDLAGGGDEDCDGQVDEDAGSTSFASDVEPILVAQCLGCHDPPAPGGGLDLSGDMYAAIVGVPSQDVPAMDQIEPGDPANSYLWHKVSNTQLSVGGAGLIMPKPPGAPLSATDLAAIEAWILDGAPL